MLESTTKRGQVGTFPATDWAVIRAAGEQAPGAHSATARICELYWQPIYHFIRRSWPSYSADEALEATHEFFARRLEARDIKNLHPEHGQFRSWLRSAAKNFLKNERRASLRERERVGSLDDGAVQHAGSWEPRTALDPELLLEHELALGVLHRALTKLEHEYGARGEAALARHARALLVPGEAPATYVDLEQSWGLRRGTLKVRLYTMRSRLKTLIRLELGMATDDDPPPSPDSDLAWLDWALSLKEEQPCAKARSAPSARSTPR